MQITKLSSKGQVVLPKAIRDDLDWPVGADLTVERRDDSVVLRLKQPVRPITIDDVAGMFKVDRRITDEEIEAAIEAERFERWRRKR